MFMQHAIYEAIYQLQWQALKYLTKLAGLGNLVQLEAFPWKIVEIQVLQIIAIKVWQIIASSHSILFATFSSPGVEMINAFANRALEGLINFYLKRMKYDLCLSPKYLISKCWFWIPIARHGPAKVWISLHKIFLVPPKYISGNFTQKIGFDADCGGRVLGLKKTSADVENIHLGTNKEI